MPKQATERINVDLPLRACGLRAVSSPRDRVSVDLRGVADRLRAEAAKRQVTAAALIRRAVLQLLGEQSLEASNGVLENGLDQHSSAEVKVTLRLSCAHARMLTVRARDADATQGRYVASLLDGMPPVTGLPEHAAAVAALRASTDGLAVLSSDLNAFLRVLGRAQLTELDCYRNSLTALTADVRDHLVCASRLIAQLAPGRRAAR